MQVTKFLLSLFLIAAFCACGNYKDTKGNSSSASPTNSTGGPATTSLLTYANVNAQVLQPKCLGCHGPTADGRVNLQTYNNVVARLADIRFQVTTGRMPQNSSLTAEQFNLLINWIDAGAPQ